MQIGPAHHPRAPRQLKVLVVDDNIINQSMARALLSKLGHTGVMVSNGEQALRCLDQLTFDVVLMDVMMPVMDGLQAVSAIREKEEVTGKHQVILMVTSHDETGDEARFIQAGADGYLAKPMDIDRLNKALTKLAP